VLARIEARLGSVEAKMDADDAITFVSPTGLQYEIDADKGIDDLLERFCGLRVLAGRRSIAARDAASGGVEWDGRFFVTFASWSPIASDNFYVYGSGGAGFSRPESVQLRQLSPTKHAKAQYYAVFEYTLYPDWYGDVKIALLDGSVRGRKGLLLRLERRLNICLERFKAAGNAPTSDILQVVSVVGVVSPGHNAAIIEEMLDVPSCPVPLLHSMYRARRFVHFHKAPMLPQGPPIALAPSVSSPVAAGGVM
jgi:hypothetical protein